MGRFHGRRNLHFFVPILPASDNQQFVIPNSFLKHLSVGDGKRKMKKKQKCEELKAILRSNGRGKTWVVKLITSVSEDGKHGKVKRMCFDHQDPSWKDFALHHGLHVGDFLVFRHIGSLSFAVIVFDSTACEKEFPPLLDHPFFDQHEHDDLKEEPTEVFQAAGTSVGYKSPSQRKFITTIKPRSLEPHYILYIPKDFARSNGLDKKNCVVTLRDREEESSWPVNLRYNMSYGHSKVYLSGGWAAFVKAKGLKEGDVCSFELIMESSNACEDNSGIAFEYTKLDSSIAWDERESAPRDHCRIPVCWRSTDGTNYSDAAAAAGEGSKTEFVITLKPYNLKPHYILFIPLAYARCNGLDKKICVIMLRDREEGTSWPVNLKYSVNNGCRVYLSGGWAAFAKAKNLKEGNVCSFKLIMKSSSVSATGNSNAITFDFTVLNSSTPCGRESKHLDYHQHPFFVGQSMVQSKGSKVVSSQVKVDAAAASSFTPSRPRFITILKYYNFSQFTLTIPLEFARANGLTEKVCMITVRDEEGHAWLMKLLYKKSSGQVYIHGGWREFCERKGLKIGDICSFELIKSSPSSGTKENKIVFCFCISRA